MILGDWNLSHLLAELVELVEADVVHKQPVAGRFDLGGDEAYAVDLRLVEIDAAGQPYEGLVELIEADDLGHAEV